MAIDDLLVNYFANFTANPYFSAGLGLLGLGTGVSILKRTFVHAIILYKEFFITSIEVTSKDKAFYWLLPWICKNCTSFSNHLSVHSLPSLSHFSTITSSPSSISPFSYSPAPGTHYVQWKGKWIKIVRERNRQSIDIANGSSPFENIILSVNGRGKIAFFHQLLHAVKNESMDKERGKLLVYTSFAADWRIFGGARRGRSMESVVLQRGIAERIVQDVREFLQSGKWYFDRGIPYRRGYLLYGPPGTGKSSFIYALASEIDYSICIINLNEAIITDDRLSHLFANIPEKSILLLEDVDALFSKKDREKLHHGNSVSFSGLLNALDGVAAAEDRIIFMTTNHIERLDPALIRPGRIDVNVYVGMADEQQAMEMFLRFFPNQIESAQLFAKNIISSGPISTATIQGLLIANKSSPIDAISSIYDTTRDLSQTQNKNEYKNCI